jgi:hypothetical protein
LLEGEEIGGPKRTKGEFGLSLVVVWFARMALAREEEKSLLLLLTLR